MGIKLKSVLKNPQLQLAFKALVFGGFLILAKLGGFGLIASLFFFLVAFLVYSRPLFNSSLFITPFIVLSIASLLVLKIFPTGQYFLLAVLFLSFLFYLLLGIKNLIFINRFFWYSLLNLSLFYLTFSLFFWTDKSMFFVAKSLLLFLTTLLLFRNSLFILVPESPDRKKKIIAGWVSAFLVLEISWVIILLPLGFINSANLAILAVFILGDSTLNYFRGTLNKRLILADVTIFIFLLLAIFGTTRWELK